MSQRQRRPVIRDDPVVPRQPKTRRQQQLTYEVEKIMDHKIINGQIFYLVKWVGWDEADNTWEPEENVLRCPLIVSEYMLNLPESVTVVPQEQK